MMIREYLLSRHVPFSSFLQPPAYSAARRAHGLHISGRLVAKAVLMRGLDGYWLAVLPSTHRIDPDRIAEATAQDWLVLAAVEEIEHIFTDCERGVLPPFGRPYGVPTIVDSHLAAASDIIVIGNARHEGLRLRYRDYEALEQPYRARFATVIAPPQGRTPRRKAG